VHAGAVEAADAGGGTGTGVEYRRCVSVCECVPTSVVGAEKRPATTSGL